MSAIVSKSEKLFELYKSKIEKGGVEADIAIDEAEEAHYMDAKIDYAQHKELLRLYRNINR